jgi:hypothetical protein
VCQQVIDTAKAQGMIPEGAKAKCLKAKKLPNNQAQFVEQMSDEETQKPAPTKKYYDLKDAT